MMEKTTAYVNAKIYTMENDGAACEAIAVRGGRFVYCGSSEQAAAMADDVIDLQGKTVIPGLIDTHIHLFPYACNLERLLLDKVTSVRELQEKLREYAKNVPKGEWIYGFGFDNERFTDDKSLPTKEVLDEACPDHKVVIGRWCMHFFSANSAALAAAGIDRNFKPEVEGTALFGEDGEPTGVLSDASGLKVVSLMPDAYATLEAKADVLEKAIRELNKKGFTGAHPVQARHVNLPEYMAAYQKLKDEGRLNARLYYATDDLEELKAHRGEGDDLLRYGYYKVFLDGGLGGRSAAMIEPYCDDPGNTGVLNYTQESLTEELRKAYSLGIQTGTHVIGDKACEMLTNSIETLLREDPQPDPRIRMIHLEVATEDVLQRIRKLPVVIDAEPLYMDTDAAWIEDRIGAARMPYANAWGRMLRDGVVVTSGSDAPGLDEDPWLGIYCCVTRCDQHGWPEGGSCPENRMSVYDAVCTYTKYAAYDSFEEAVKGTIAPGKLADFLVLDRDIFTVEPEMIKDTRVLKTVLGGRTVYEA